MSLLLVAFVSILGTLLGKYLFKKWFNHLSIYTAIIGGLVFFYELKYLPYPDIIPLAWFYIIGAFLSFLFGILTLISIRNLYQIDDEAIEPAEYLIPLLADGGKTVKYAILFFSIIGLLVALQRWLVLIDKFGSIAAVFINAGIVYRLNVDGEIKEFIPILPNFVYIAVFLSGIYTAYKKRFSFLTFLPFIGIVLKELTYFGRGEMLFALLEFTITFFLFRHLLQNENKEKYKFSRKNAIIASTLLLAFIIAAASLVRTSRGAHENYVGATKELRDLEDNFIVSPSVYLYLSSDVGVFSKYLQDDGENTMWGENTFKSFYFFLARFEIVEKPSFFQKGYYIPMWTNTGTYMRELHADFGPAGVFLGPYLLGILLTWLWFKFYREKNIFVLVIMVYCYLIVGFSFLMMVTRLNQWLLSQILIFFFLPIFERIATRNRVLDK